MHIQIYIGSLPYSSIKKEVALGLCLKARWIEDPCNAGFVTRMDGRCMACNLT